MTSVDPDLKLTGLERRGLRALLAEMIEIVESRIVIMNDRPCPECHAEHVYSGENYHESTCRGARAVADARDALEILDQRAES